MRAWASAALQAELDSDEIEIEQRVDGKLLADNLRGLNISVEPANLRNDMAAYQLRNGGTQVKNCGARGPGRLHGDSSPATS